MKKAIILISILFTFTGCAKAQLNGWFFVGDNALYNKLVSVWELDETSGVIAYDSYGSINLANVGTTVNQSGKIGKSYLFSGGTDYLTRVYVADELAPKNLYSFSVWVKIPTGINYDTYCIMARGWRPIADPYTNRGAIHSFELEYVYGYMYFKFHYTDSNYVLTTTSASLTYVTYVDEWIHFVCTRDSDTITIYVNGATNGSVSGGNGDLLDDEYTYNGIDIFGAYYEPDGTREYNFSGYLDQMAVWSKVLTATEIAQLYNSGSGLAYMNW